MLLAIISDTHDNVSNIEKFLSWAKINKIKIIIHCGDITTSEMITKFFGPAKINFHCVLGNASNHETIPRACKNFSNTNCHGDKGELNIENLKIGFCHFPETAKKMTQEGNYQLIFYGHTHKPWMETLNNNCQIINPGTLGGVFQKATFAIYDTKIKKIELKILELL